MSIHIKELSGSKFEITVNNVLESYSEAPIKIYINQYNRALISEQKILIDDYAKQVDDLVKKVNESTNNYRYETSLFELTSNGFSTAGSYLDQGNSKEFATEVTFTNFNPGSLKDINDLENIDPKNPDTWIIEGGLSEIVYKENGSEIVTIALDENSLMFKITLTPFGSITSPSFNK